MNFATFVSDWGLPTSSFAEPKHEHDGVFRSFNRIVQQDVQWEQPSNCTFNFRIITNISVGKAEQNGA